MAGLQPDGQPAPADGSLPDAALACIDSQPLSIYVHIPFCASRCGYCDFNTYTNSELGSALQEPYLAAVCREIELAAQILGDAPPVSTIFVGGGTPTLLTASQLGGLLAAIERQWGLAAEVEITTEANPETVTQQSLADLRAAGFSRISLGMQSSVSHVLQTLERSHTPQRSIQATWWARQAGFEHISLDLIYGTPGESFADWRDSIQSVLTADIDHVSAYALIVEDGTRLQRKIANRLIPAPDDDDLADKYLYADQQLSAAGFHNYEVSNWAKPDGECRHNLAYWLGRNWWGIGAGAHSHIAGVRWWNVKHPRSYIQRLSTGNSPALAREILTELERHEEQILLELRLGQGLPLSALTPAEQANVAIPVEQGLAVVDAGRLKLTLAGRLLADAVIRDLVVI